jgi:hypothetical protein
VSVYRLEVRADGSAETKMFDLDATNRPDAEYEAEYVMHMFPLRLSRREGRLFRVDDGRLIKQFEEEASDR